MELLGGRQTRFRSRNLSLFQESGYGVQDYSYEGIIGKITSESMTLFLNSFSNKYTFYYL